MNSEVAPWASAHQGDHLLGIAGAEVKAPSWQVSLPCLTILWASMLLAVLGEFSVEIFAGSAILTLRLMLSQVPVVRSWDAKYGEAWNVLSEGHVAQEMIRRSMLVLLHIATPCLTSTFARRSPLRSWSQPFGISGLSPVDQELLDDGNRLIAWSMLMAQTAHECRSYFSVENTFPLFVWLSPF